MTKLVWFYWNDDYRNAVGETLTECLINYGLFVTTVNSHGFHMIETYTSADQVRHESWLLAKWNISSPHHQRMSCHSENMMNAFKAPVSPDCIHGRMVLNQINILAQQAVVALNDCAVQVKMEQVFFQPEKKWMSISFPAGGGIRSYQVDFSTSKLDQLTINLMRMFEETTTRYVVDIDLFVAGTIDDGPLIARKMSVFGSRVDTACYINVVRHLRDPPSWVNILSEIDVSPSALLSMSMAFDNDVNYKLTFEAGNHLALQNQGSVLDTFVLRVAGENRKSIFDVIFDVWNNTVRPSSTSLVVKWSTLLAIVVANDSIHIFEHVVRNVGWWVMKFGSTLVDGKSPSAVSIRDILLFSFNAKIELFIANSMSSFIRKWKCGIDFKFCSLQESFKLATTCEMSIFALSVTIEEAANWTPVDRALVNEARALLKRLKKNEALKLKTAASAETARRRSLSETIDRLSKKTAQSAIDSILSNARQADGEKLRVDAEKWKRVRSMNAAASYRAKKARNERLVNQTETIQTMTKKAKMQKDLNIPPSSAPPPKPKPPPPPPPPPPLPKSTVKPPKPPKPPKTPKTPKPNASLPTLEEHIVLDVRDGAMVQTLADLSMPLEEALDNDDKLSTVGTSIASSQACIVCFESAIESACIPCGHRCLCKDCSDRFRHPGATCPVCRVEIFMVCKIFG